MNLQEQLREAMKGTERHPRGNLEGAPEVDTDYMLKSLGAREDEPEPEQDVQHAEEPGEDAPAGEEAGEGEREPVRLTDLAELLEWTPEAVYAVQVPLGEGEIMTLGQMKDAIREANTIRETRDDSERELAEREAAIEAREARLMQQVELAAPAELVRAEAALHRAQDDYSRIDWVQLETTNPGQAALQRQKLIEQIGLAKQQRDSIQANIEALRGDLQTQAKQKQEQYLKQARLELHRLIPTWANESTFAREREALVAYGVEQGMDEVALRSVADPKVIVYLYRNWQRDQKIEKARPVEKPPKVLKPQAAANRTAGRKAKVDKLVEGARKSKDTRDKQAAVRELIKGVR